MLLNIDDVLSLLVIGQAVIILVLIGILMEVEAIKRGK